MILKAKQLLETRLSTLGFPTAYDNVSFEQPNELFLACTLTIPKPDDAGFGDIDYYRERFRFVVVVHDEPNQGTGNCLEVAEQVRNLFKRGTTLEDGNIRLQVLNVPHVSTPINLNTGIAIPVNISVLAENLSL